MHKTGKDHNIVSSSGKNNLLLFELNLNASIKSRPGKPSVFCVTAEKDVRITFYLITQISHLPTGQGNWIPQFTHNVYLCLLFSPFMYLCMAWVFVHLCSHVQVCRSLRLRLRDVYHSSQSLEVRHLIKPTVLQYKQFQQRACAQIWYLPFKIRIQVFCLDL